MRTNARGKALIQSFESCVLRAYPDPKTGGAPWTCGWGSTGPSIGPGTVWTQAQADERFEEDLASFERMVDDAVTVTINENQNAALVSIVFNVGPGGRNRDGIIRLKTGQPSTLLRRLNEGDYAMCSLEFPKWCSPGSAVEKGLRRRREAERALFESAP